MHLCHAAQSVLVVVDVQTGLLPAMTAAAGDQLVQNSIKLLKVADLLDIPTLVTEQYPQGLGHTVAELQAHYPEPSRVVEKRTFSALQCESFKDLFDYTGRRQAVICGMEAHVCVLQTVMGFLDMGIQPFVVSDALCSRLEHHKQNALERMVAAGGVISNVESTLFEWVADSRHPKFRQILADVIR